jgi:LacI family transcriptional regulator
MDNASSPESESRSRIADVARAAGVSTATVDRVLHGRPNVKSATAQRVLKAAAALQYLPDADLFQALKPPPTPITFLLPAGTNRYLTMLGETVAYMKDQLVPYNVRCSTHFIEGFNPKVLAERLLHHGRRSSGVACMALEHPLVREAINTLDTEGVPVVTLITDVLNSPRVAFVGMDNRAAGRTAGLLLGRFIGTHTRSCKVAMFAGSLSYRGHEEREMGFQHILAESFPAMRVVGLREGQDDAEINYRQARHLLRQHPDLAGIYNVGGASDGIARALKEVRRDQEIVFIGHGLTPETRALLIDGTLDAVLNVSPQTLVQNSVRVFSHLRERKSALAGIEPVRIGVVFRENLP